jgi:hypothetical protein
MALDGLHSSEINPTLGGATLERTLNDNMKHAVQRGIRAPTQHPLQDQGKPRKTPIEPAGLRTLRTQIDLQPAVRHQNTQAITLVHICTVAPLKKFTSCFHKH